MSHLTRLPEGPVDSEDEEEEDEDIDRTDPLQGRGSCPRMS